MLPYPLAQVDVRHERRLELLARERREGHAAIERAAVEDRLDGGPLVGVPVRGDDRVDHDVLGDRAEELVGRRQRPQPEGLAPGAPRGLAVGLFAHVRCALHGRVQDLLGQLERARLAHGTLEDGRIATLGRRHEHALRRLLQPAEQRREARQRADLPLLDERVDRGALVGSARLEDHVEGLGGLGRGGGLGTGLEQRHQPGDPAGLAHRLLIRGRVLAQVANGADHVGHGFPRGARLQELYQ